jgi:hypothetical protein
VIEFRPFPKVARFNREWVVTEKMDGSNASVSIERMADVEHEIPADSAVVLPPGAVALGQAPDGDTLVLYAGSRNRWLQPGKNTDNFGFAAWVVANARELSRLGVGTHFGEWWGQGIQRGYGLTEKRFSLFNVSKWADDSIRPACCHVVPVLARTVTGPEEMKALGLTDTIGVEVAIRAAIHQLREYGSAAAPGFVRPEGIVIFHTHSNGLFKITLDGDGHKTEKSKGNQ